MNTSEQRLATMEAIDRVCGNIKTVPNKPKTTIRGVRVSDELWEAAQKVAADRGESVSDEVRAALERYVRRNTKPRS